MQPKFQLFACDHPKSLFSYAVNHRGKCYTIEEINCSPVARSFNSWWAKPRSSGLCYAYLDKLKQSEHWNKYTPSQFDALERKMRDSVELHAAALVQGFITPVSAQERSIIDDKNTAGILVGVILLVCSMAETATVIGCFSSLRGFWLLAFLSVVFPVLSLFVIGIYLQEMRAKNYELKHVADREADWRKRRGDALFSSSYSAQHFVKQYTLPNNRLNDLP